MSPTAPQATFTRYASRVSRWPGSTMLAGRLSASSFTRDGCSSAFSTAPLWWSSSLPPAACSPRYHDVIGSIGGHRCRTRMDWMRGELAAGGRLELHHRGAVEKADEQPSLVKEEAERRPANMVLPGHLET